MYTGITIESNNIVNLKSENGQKSKYIKSKSFKISNTVLHNKLILIQLYNSQRIK